MYSRMSTRTPAFTASSAALSSSLVIFSSTYSSPQFAQIFAGTPLITSVMPSRSKVTVVLPSFVSPCLQITHLITFSLEVANPREFTRSTGYELCATVLYSSFKFRAIIKISLEDFLLEECPSHIGVRIELSLLQITFPYNLEDNDLRVGWQGILAGR